MYWVKPNYSRNNGNSRIVLSTFTKIKGSQSQHGNLRTSQVSFVQMVDITGMQTDPLRTPILRWYITKTKNVIMVLTIPLSRFRMWCCCYCCWEFFVEFYMWLLVAMASMWHSMNIYNSNSSNSSPDWCYFLS